MISFLLPLLVLPQGETNLVKNSRLELGRTVPDGFTLSGAAKWWQGGYPDEITTGAIRLDSRGVSGLAEGTVSTTVSGLDQGKGKWVRFSVRGLAEDKFELSGNELGLEIAFLAGTRVVETAKRLVYKQILQDRKDFTVNGDKGKLGASVWRTYDFEEILPFPEIDGVRLSVVMKGGSAKAAKDTNFFVDDFSLEQSKVSSRGFKDPADRMRSPTITAVSTEGMISLGGRWFYKPTPSEQIKTTAGGKLDQVLTVREKNSGQLFYKTDRLSAIFKGSMSSWLLPGHMNYDRSVVQASKYVEDNLWIDFRANGWMTVYSRNIPNHPTAKFPDTYGTQGYNPSYIKAQQNTYNIRTEPMRNSQGFGYDKTGKNNALNMGPVGFAINGVQFFNPFDAGMTDASSIMDRCCGHPAPDFAYHYHKYPICVNTPFVDDGSEHSTVLGFALDGFPVYGPYESAGLMAMNDNKNPLNAMNGHSDSQRGFHYHVTPGRFPYIIGGYYGLTR